jgi:hypothetical protein
MGTIDAVAAALFLCLARQPPSDVVHATRLPFDPGSSAAGCASPVTAVLRGGALEPEPRAPFCEKRMQKQTRFRSAIYQRDAQRVFLSQAGPRFDLALLQAEHHLPGSVLVLASETTKATRWVALASSFYAARGLGHRPRNEGWGGGDAAVGDVLVHARRPRRGSRRSGKEKLGVGLGQHRLVGTLPGRRIDHGSDVRKGCL